MSNPDVSALAMHEPAATGICAVKRVTKAAVGAPACDCPVDLL
jgi:hypothetical protein